MPTQDDFGDDNAEAKFFPSDPTLGEKEALVRRAEFLGDYIIGAGGAGFHSQREDEEPDSYLQGVM